MTDDFDVDRYIDWDDGYVAWLFGIGWGDGYVDWGRYCVISEIGLGSDGIAALILGSRTGSRTLYGASPRNTSQIKRLQNKFDILKGCKKSRRAKKERAPRCTSSSHIFQIGIRRCHAHAAE